MNIGGKNSRFKEKIKRYLEASDTQNRNNQDKIYVTRPSLPPFEEFIHLLREIWESGWLTNQGQFHEQFEKQLSQFLEVENTNLFTNGTIALVTALQALRIQGKVITTPYSFPATTHALHWNGIKPVFADIKPDTLTLDPEKVEAAISPDTTAILPTHVYGFPCEVEKIQEIADIYGLRVIYDAAPAFNVKKNGESILNFGDLSVLSFHATKVFTTFEGGAISSNSETLKERIDYLKNFGFAGETKVVAPGINGKMNEFQAALGLAQLQYIENYIEQRKKIAEHYYEKLPAIEGIRVLKQKPGIKYNYGYFPILVNKNQYGIDRDELYNVFKEYEIYTRRYYYPLISEFPSYRGFESAKKDNLSIAHTISRQVLCLPIYPDLEQKDVNKIIEIIEDKGE